MSLGVFPNAFDAAVVTTKVLTGFTELHKIENVDEPLALVNSKKSNRNPMCIMTKILLIVTITKLPIPLFFVKMRSTTISFIFSASNQFKNKIKMNKFPLIDAK